MSYVEDYLAEIDEPACAAFEHVLAVAREVAPDAEAGTSYAMPALKLHGKGLIGFIRAKGWLSVFPMSGSILPVLADRLDGFDWDKGTLRFQPDQLPSDDVIRDIVWMRRAQIEAKLSKPR